MDPLAAIGLANNIVAFVEFASKIITGAHEVYSSATGTTSNNADMALVIGDVRAMTRRLHVVKPVTDDDIALQDLVVKCQELSTDLISTLSRLQTKDPKSKTASMRVAWRAMRSKDKVESLEKRIERYRAQILDRILIMMRLDPSQYKPTVFLANANPERKLLRFICSLRRHRTTTLCWLINREAISAIYKTRC
jgi:hypothetical protein